MVFLGSGFRNGMNPVKQAIAICWLIFVLAGCSSLTGLYFYPQSVWVRTPEALGLSYQDVWLQSRDGTQLHAWWLPAAEKTVLSDMVVLFLHGNSGNVSNQILGIDWLPLRGAGVLALDYRGFGASQGRSMMPDVLQDIESAAIWLRQHYPDKQLVVLGQSMGAVLAVNFVAHAGEQYQVKRVVLDAPFSGFPRIARHAMYHTWLGWIFSPLTWLVPGDWEAVEQAAGITQPTLVMHSQKDRIIPYEHGRAVYHALSGPSCWLEVEGEHIQSFRYLAVREATLSFLVKGQCPPQAYPSVKPNEDTL